MLCEQQVNIKIHLIKNFVFKYYYRDIKNSKKINIYTYAYLFIIVLRDDIYDLIIL